MAKMTLCGGWRNGGVIAKKKLSAIVAYQSGGIVMAAASSAWPSQRQWRNGEAYRSMAAKIVT